MPATTGGIMKRPHDARQSLGMEQDQRKPDAEHELQNERQHIKGNRHPETMPELVVGDELGVIGKAREGLLARRRKALKRQPDGIGKRKRDHADRERDGRRRQRAQLETLPVLR
jgi:hypothetical protein